MTAEHYDWSSAMIDSCSDLQTPSFQNTIEIKRKTVVTHSWRFLRRKCTDPLISVHLKISILLVYTVKYTRYFPLGEPLWF